jgi:nucleotide-binding universal stress UspA family protein
MHYDHILVTTDFSTNSSAAFEIAAHQAKFEGSKITLLTVVHDWVVPETMLEHLPQPERIDEYRHALRLGAKVKLQDIARERFHGQEVTTVVILTEEPPYQEICSYAKTNNCSLIIMASRGRGAVTTLLLGSTVQKVCHLAHCPVMVVPCPGR